VVGPQGRVVEAAASVMRCGTCARARQHEGWSVWCAEYGEWVGSCDLCEWWEDANNNDDVSDVPLVGDVAR
jgi:hypothetical protein